MEEIELINKSGITIRGFRYDASMKTPEGFNARTTSQGAQCTVTRDDGVVLHAYPMDWFLKPVGGDWVVMSHPAFQAFFRVVG